jgi:hypothetical protein
MSFGGATTTVPGLGGVQDEDVVFDDNGTWSVYFDGTAHGLTADTADLDAFSLDGSATPPPPPGPGAGPLSFSTWGNSNPPGVTGTADDADIYDWNGTSYIRAIDVTAAPYGLPAGANVDAFARVDAKHFYLSFANDTTTVTGLGTVQDEDVVYWNDGSWSVYFDGTSHGLGGNANLDVDAISVDGPTLYFSTAGNSNPPGPGGTADDADVYSWNGTVYSRVWDATANGVPGAASLDGLDRVDATHLYLSFANDPFVTVPGLGAVQDEDVVFWSAGSWSVYFDGTAHGLSSDNQHLDAIDVP